jgi:hypothetical protein
MLCARPSWSSWWSSGRGFAPGACRRLAALATVLAACLLGGCVEVDEAWKLTREGSGTYDLTLRWNADLMARVRDTVGPKVAAAFEGRAFPLRLEEWREGLKALPSVDIRRLEEQDLPGGWRELHAVLAFGRMEDLLGWEVLARRTVRVDPPDKDRQVRLHMEPLHRLPVLDPLLAAEQVLRAPPPPAELPAAAREGAPRDPPPLERLGLTPETLTLARRMLEPRLAEVRFTFRFELAGRVRSAAAPATKAAGSSVEYVWRWADLAPGRTRNIDVVYVPGEFDAVPLVDHQGDAPKAEGPAAAR